MNTFGSDLSKILSAREQAHDVGGAPTDVPVIKADTIKKAEPEKAEPEKGELEKEKEELEKEKEEPENKDQKESEV